MCNLNILRYRPLHLLAMLALLSGCATTSLEELRAAKPSGTAFQQALAEYYLAFAESESTQYDWADVRHFADKGLLAAYGNDVTPEDPAHWNISKSMLPELMAGYEKLMGVLTPGQREKHPELTAHAQFLYDCWVEQQEENWQPDHIASCRDGFYKIIDTLNGSPATTSQPSIKSSAYIVFFTWDSSAITPAAKQVINSVVVDLAREETYEIILNSHTDRSGSDAYNVELSKKRAEAVKSELIQGGVNADRITFYAFGESDTRTPTKNGAREKNNRRVEIYIDQ